MPHQKLELNILYEDNDLLVIDKPAGLLVIPDRWDASKPTVVKLARAYRNTQAAAAGTIVAEPPRIWVVHRLDRDTSGVLILAKSDRVHAALAGKGPASARNSGWAARIWRPRAACGSL